MKQVAGFVSDYFKRVNVWHLITITLAISILIWINYHYQLNNQLLLHHSFGGRFWRMYALFFLTFAVTWTLGFMIDSARFPLSGIFWMLIILSPAIFALKVSLQIGDVIQLRDIYWQTVLQWPLKAVAAISAALIIWRGAGLRKPFAGLQSKGFNARPYFFLLLLMLPLLIAASFGSDFQQVYPKLRMIATTMNIAQKFFFELCYGLDFFTIEIFFRGFLVLVFVKYGIKAVLPMAAFYCTIHFGKPLFECISSYFGGLILGAVIVRTRSVWGGLIIHLGIAWAMEIIGLLQQGI